MAGLTQLWPEHFEHEKIVSTRVSLSAKFSGVVIACVSVIQAAIFVPLLSLPEFSGILWHSL
jgi:hypothetical protein